jgi:hypothetical protein
MLYSKIEKVNYFWTIYFGKKVIHFETCEYIYKQNKKKHIKGCWWNLRTPDVLQKYHQNRKTETIYYTSKITNMPKICLTILEQPTKLTNFDYMRRLFLQSTSVVKLI